MAEPEFHHVPVLPEAVIEGLNIQPGGRYLDATAGGGGHSRLILEAEPTVSLVAVDQDAAAIAATQANLAEFGDGEAPAERQRVAYWHGNFAEFKPTGNPFSGILADLGVSSVQLDLGDRGFSFRQSAPLDMRMDPRQDLTAADIVNYWDETDLANVIYTYGEERLSRRIARKIVDQRPWQTTTDLAEAIAYCVPRSYRYGRIHPATRTFQALRIAVNRELEALETLLKAAPRWLAPGGRLVIISFHSLEDRLVKHTLKNSPELKVITKKPMVATEDEISQNPRARSAKLRVAERREAL
ncbi:16S rRNA (cytosine(1402)-N(4))-methyltransferase RsmH [Nodosilinea sp. PGN35]|uniref:16S rRNA (cytosine(1402)-N(4))-methyltransferase RsmH n=1 Tax=Nodosilinea sp. PGN35 TaxID=3020489 RepID=UPI0023B2FD64|nr:16S rRNA (cytosine(1402)-N(4))-methyltransferase RsmH [Nodosilinea sp. TSF1-S3]MDF0369512.1 16S rRNA (cytosine(1402)-N(4))-methyltransferase RsmH [Nodosilinea sp. TSF1-S3]